MVFIGILKLYEFAAANTGAVKANVWFVKILIHLVPFQPCKLYLPVVPKVAALFCVLISIKLNAFATGRLNCKTV